MARYRKISIVIWNDEKIKGLSDASKLTWIFLLTHQNMTVLGAMRGTIPGFAAEMGWPQKKFRRAFDELVRVGLVKHDERVCCVWLPKFLKHNSPTSPNAVRGWGSAIEYIPECSLRHEIIQAAKDFAENMPANFRAALPQVFRRSSELASDDLGQVIRTHEHERYRDEHERYRDEHEHEHDRFSPLGVCVADTHNSNTDKTTKEIGIKLIDNWNAMAKMRGFALCSGKPTGKTGKLFETRIANTEWVSAYPKALEKLAVIKWIHRGGRLATFTRFVEPDTVRQLVDGEWDDKTHGFVPESIRDTEDPLSRAIDGLEGAK